MVLKAKVAIELAESPTWRVVDTRFWHVSRWRVAEEERFYIVR